jgi:hypothetical protein
MIIIPTAISGTAGVAESVTSAGTARKPVRTRASVGRGIRRNPAAAPPKTAPIASAESRNPHVRGTVVRALGDQRPEDVDRRDDDGRVEHPFDRDREQPR